MTIYPVKLETYNSNGDEVTIVKPFTSMSKARKFFNDESKSGQHESVEQLDPLDFPINKTGLIMAFNFGQELAR